MPALDNRRHELFARKRAEGLSEADAYTAAGFKPNPEAAARLAQRVAARIEDIKAETRNSALAITQERILREYARIGFADIRKAIDWANALAGQARGPRGRNLKKAKPSRPSAALGGDDDFAAAIAEVRRSSSGALSVRLHPKLPALEALAEHLKSLQPARPKSAASATRAPEPAEDAPRLSENELKRRLAFALRSAERNDTPSISDEEQS